MCVEKSLVESRSDELVNTANNAYRRQCDPHMTQ